MPNPGYAPVYNTASCLNLYAVNCKLTSCFGIQSGFLASEYNTTIVMCSRTFYTNNIHNDKHSRLNVSLLNVWILAPKQGFTGDIYYVK